MIKGVKPFFLFKIGAVVWETVVVHVILAIKATDFDFQYE